MPQLIPGMCRLTFCNESGREYTVEGVAANVVIGYDVDKIPITSRSGMQFSMPGCASMTVDVQIRGAKPCEDKPNTTVASTDEPIPFTEVETGEPEMPAMYVGCTVVEKDTDGNFVKTWLKAEPFSAENKREAIVHLARQLPVDAPPSSKLQFIDPSYDDLLRDNE